MEEEIGKRNDTVGAKEAIKGFKNKVCAGALFLGASVSIFSLAIGNVPVSKGFLLGTCFSIMNFTLMSHSIPLSFGKDRKKASLINFGSILTRYLILAMPIIIAIKSSDFELISTIAGIFSIQMVLFGYYVIIRPFRENKVSMM